MHYDLMKSLLLIFFLPLASCALRTEISPAPAPPTNSFLTTTDGKHLSLRHWNLQQNPDIVIIALHGLAGAARDFNNLAEALPTQSPGTTLYALNLRGLGYDDDAAARGDIRDSKLWLRDLEELHDALSQRHPEARFVWLGESMGGLIALHTATRGIQKPDGIILASPVVNVNSIPPWQRFALTLASKMAPCARLSLETVAGGDFHATDDSQHFEQSETNVYYIERFTLRFLNTLATMAGQMPQQARQTDPALPVLILQGGQDFLSPPKVGRQFATLFPSSTRHQTFSKSHHLLFYDQDRSQVVSEVLRWVNSATF
jgi:alpha-beta hydrolase superfamily lysophospholipase